MTRAGSKLRNLLAEPEQLVVPETLTGGFARLAETMGFKALYCGGQALGSLHFAIPDHGLITMTELLECCGRIADVVDVPVICDADQGGETLVNVYRTVRDFERAGAASIHLEDTRNPKHLYGVEGALMPTEDMVARIKTAVDARRDESFVIIGRSDCCANGSALEETIERGLAYQDAGADVFFPCMLSPEHAPKLAEALRIPVMDIHVTGYSVDRPSVKMKVIAGTMAAALFGTTYDLLKQLKETGEMSPPNMELGGARRAEIKRATDAATGEKAYQAVVETMSRQG